MDFIKKIVSQILDIQKQYLRLVMTVHMKLVHYFTMNSVGYGIYVFSVFCTFTPIFGEYAIVKAFFVLIFFYVFGQTWILYIAFKIPYTRRMLDNLVGKDFIVELFGKNSATPSIWKTVLPFGAFVFGQALSTHVDHYQQMEKLDRYIDVVNKAQEVHEFTPEMNQDVIKTV